MQVDSRWVVVVVDILLTQKCYIMGQIYKILSQLYRMLMLISQHA